jgi:hypothetical protein
MKILIEILNLIGCAAFGALLGFFVLVPFLGVA